MAVCGKCGNIEEQIMGRKNGDDNGKKKQLHCIAYAKRGTEEMENFLADAHSIISIEMITGEIPHPPDGKASKSVYSDSEGKKTYVLERVENSESFYNESGGVSEKFHNELWKFDRDFTLAEAKAFVEKFDRDAERARNEKPD